MKLDQFVLFCLSIRQQEQVAKYHSPHYASVFKGVPLDELDEMKQLCKQLTGRKVRVKYRGPRTGSIYDTYKKDATSASIYIKYDNPWEEVVV